jgi:NAD(P)-dependent dehydrogenase (short-subunit alcohol dehydrogenase family)
VLSERSDRVAGELANKVAIVTGGSSGIGYATVEKFLAEGARVVIADVDREHGEELAKAGGTDVIFQRTDVAQPDQVAELVSAAVATFGGLHIMVNNAGVSGTMQQDFLEDDLADFQRVMNINVLGVMAGTRFAGRHMSAHGGGSIINISSIGGIQAGPGVMTYRASKAAVIHFSKSAALALARHDIRVNCIAPGNIPTPLLAASAANLGQELQAQFVETTRELMRATRPLQRDGTAGDVADTVAYFASDRTAYITGTVLPVDGGSVAGVLGPRPGVDTRAPASVGG